MKITIRRIKELTGMKASLEVYVNGRVVGSIKPAGSLEFTTDEPNAEIYVKTSICESNRLRVTSDAQLKAYARGGLLGATFLSIYNRKKTYVLKEVVESKNT